ncbi:MAG TPA: biotin transporter BioY [Oscillospiraceae bacterium]|nr:biotin transporter BioY [Oscillospiraceae bacterium]
MKNKSILSLTYCALFAALTAILSQVSIPIGPVPINLATLSVVIAGSVLGAKYGALSQFVYVLLGAAGLPVFAGFRGGIHAIVGPTGGYILGYIAAAWLVGQISRRFGGKIVYLIVSMAAGIALCYVLGTVWFMTVTKTGLWASLMLCVFPFLIGDAAKIAVAVALVPQLRKVFQKTFAGQAI